MNKSWNKIMRITFFKAVASTITGMFLVSQLGAQQTYTFTTAGATGQFGPNQTQVNAAYSGTNLLNGMVTVSGSGIQLWTVPGSGNYKIKVVGASGGMPSSYTHYGLGASMEGEFTLTGGQVLKVLVGQAGANSSAGGSGGGGTFVADNLNTPLIVAGGGAGGGNYANPVAGIMDGRITNYGANYQSTGRATAGGGGGSFNVSGLNANGGSSFISGGAGGALGGANGGLGGFGGGAGSSGSNALAAGGGGYSGGDEMYGYQVYQANEGGGGSYNSGINQINAAGVNTGDGVVIITRLCNFDVSAAKNPICIGESVVLTTDASAPISWSTGGATSSVVVSPTTTTTYSISGTGTGTTGCVTSAVIQVSVVNLPVITPTVNPILVCVGETATLSTSGAVTYTWSNNTNGTMTTVSPVVNTTYSVSGTSIYGCINNDVITVNVNPNTISVPAATTICQNTMLNILASGAVSYTWSNGVPLPGIIVSPSVNTVYSVIGIDANNCVLTNSVSVNVNSAPNVFASSDKDVVCKGESVTLSGTGASTYAWNNAITGSGSGASLTLNLNIDVPYTFSVNGTNANGCTGTATVLVMVEKCSGINEAEGKNLSVILYPNPTSGLFTIKSEKVSSGTIEIMDLSGKIIFTETIKASATDVNMSEFAAGVYFVKVKSETSSEVIKLIRNQ